MAASNTETCFTEDIFSSLALRFGYNQLKTFQKYVIKCVLMDKQDTFVSCKTGSGKSLCFQGITTVCNSMGNNNPIVLVISPLLSLMESQVNKLRELGISATIIGRDLDENLQIRRGEFNYVYANPENIVGQKVWRDMLKTGVYTENLQCLVFDEVHTAVTWGLQKGEDVAFRPEFSKVGELRALVPSVPVLALTATASPSVRQKITELLSMKHVKEVVESPDRDNIILTVKKLHGDPLSSFKWLSDKLAVEGKKCPKHLIYCRRISDCSKLYRYFEDQLGEKSYAQGRSQKSENRLFNMFHSRTVSKIKENVLQSIQNEESCLRVLIATNAVGMGLDFLCNFVINFGPPSEFDDYLQQIGRVGRDGSQSHSVLLYHGPQLRKVTPEMLSFVKNKEQCRRNLLKHLYGDITEKKSVTGCSCCDVCAVCCMCNNCACNASPFSVTTVLEKENLLERDMTAEMKMRLETHLLGLKNELDRSAASSLYSRVCKGLSIDMINEILHNAQYIFDVDFLLDRCGILDFQTAVMVYGLFSALFGDTNEDILFSDDTLPQPADVNLNPV